MVRYRQFCEGLRVTDLQHRVARDNKRHVLVHMHPRKFLELTTPNDDHVREIRRKSKPLVQYNKWSKDQEIYNAPNLTVGDGDKITSHEGRHRAAALIKSGHKRMPVHIRISKGSDDWLERLKAGQIYDRDLGWEHVPNTIRGQYGRGELSKTELKLLRDRVAGGNK